MVCMSLFSPFTFTIGQQEVSLYLKAGITVGCWDMLVVASFSSLVAIIVPWTLASIVVLYSFRSLSWFFFYIQQNILDMVDWGHHLLSRVCHNTLPFVSIGSCCLMQNDHKICPVWGIPPDNHTCSEVYTYAYPRLQQHMYIIIRPQQMYISLTPPVVGRSHTLLSPLESYSILLCCKHTDCSSSVLTAFDFG